MVRTHPSLRRPRRALLALCLVCLVASGCGSAQGADGPEARSRTTETSRVVTTTTVAPTTTSTAPTTTTAPPPPPRTTVAPIFPPSSTPPRPVDTSSPVRILALGDSTAFSIGWGVAAAGQATGLATTAVDSRTSTGLTRTDYFDWPTQLLTLAVAPPEVAVVSFGANDSQPLVRPDGSVVAFGAPGWSEEYARRVDGVLALLTGLGVRVYWVGQPVARDPGYSDGMAVLDAVYREVTGRYPGATYVDASYWLTDESGAYTDTLPGPDGAPVVIRDEDGIHLATAGGDYLGAVVLNQILADYGVAL